SRKNILTLPVKCIRKDAWLGEGYYYWHDLFDAEKWGLDAKRSTGFFEIYTSEIEYENILDAVFNEDHYFFWLSQIEKVASIFNQKTQLKPSIKELNDYFKEKGIWAEVDGIQFQDLPVAPTLNLVQPIKNYPRPTYFLYRKRIQLVVFNNKIILNFTLLRKGQCI
ncbi:MAG: hypothetical protein ABIR66_07265, partial [Saprospiraceae bacterium]